MEWWAVLSIFLGFLLLGFASGMPVAFVFITINFAALYFLGGGINALAVPLYSAFNALTSFILVPVPLFIFMGEVLAVAGIIPIMINALDLWIGRIPGRLSLVAIIGGTVFGALSGASLGVAGMMSDTLVPEMKRHRYSNSMTLGPIMSGSLLALIIPPTAIGIVLAAVADVSIAQFLIALVLPGLLMAACYTVYVITRARLKPDSAPPYTGVGHISARERLNSLKHIIPAAFIIFLVTGVIFLGVATPSEAAALGALGTIIVTAAYLKLTMDVMKKALVSTVRLTATVFMIYIGSAAFSQVLAYSGGTAGLIQLATGLTEYPILVLIVMHLVLLILGMFVDQISMIMISIPIYIPVITVLGLDPVWFCVLALINMATGQMTPPFGLLLFVVKAGVPDVKMKDIWAASIPYCLINILVIIVIIAFPKISQFLPSLMR